MDVSFSDIRIEDILPHRGRMKLVDKIIEIHKDKVVTEAVVNETWPLIRRKNISPLILIELVAQTAGICNGIERIKKYGLNSEKKGWIVGIKKAVFHVMEIPVGSRIVTHIENRFKYDAFREIKGKAIIGSITACEVILQVFQPESENQIQEEAL